MVQKEENGIDKGLVAQGRMFDSTTRVCFAVSSCNVQGHSKCILWNKNYPSSRAVINTEDDRDACVQETLNHANANPIECKNATMQDRCRKRKVLRVSEKRGINVCSNEINLIETVILSDLSSMIIVGMCCKRLLVPNRVTTLLYWTE